MTAFALPAIQAPGYDKALQAWAERVRSAAEIALGTTPGNSMLLNRWLLKEKHGAFFTLGESSEGLLAVHMPSTNETPGAPQPQVQIVSSDAATKMAQLAVSTCVLTGNLAAQWFVGKTGRGPNTSWDSLIEIDVRTLTLDEIADRIGTTSLMNWKWSSAAQ